MDVGEIRQFLHALGCQKISAGSKWVRATCPMGHLHSGGKDRQPSFAVSINPGDESHCRCQACGIYGGLTQLIWRISADGKRPRPDLFDFLVQHNQIDAEKICIDRPEPAEDDIKGRILASRKYIQPPKRESKFVHPDDEPQAEVPEDTLRQMIADMPDYVLEYLTRRADPVMGVGGRGLEPHTVVEWELGWHPVQRRICIPIRDESGKLVAVSGRAFDDNARPKYLHSRFKRDRVLFGEHRHDASIRSGFLFEGFFQTIYSWQCGYTNVNARMGTHLSRQQAEKLVRWFDHLTIVPDGDRAGRDAAERDRRTLADLEFPGRPFDPPGKGAGTFRIEQIDIANMPNKMDADTLKPDVLRAVLGPQNTA